MLSLYVCLCTSFVPGGYAGQKTVSDPLELELQTAVSGQVF